MPSLPPKNHNAQEYSGYEAAVKTLIHDKLHALDAKQAEQVNLFVSALLEHARKEKAEADLPYGEWTDDELKIMSLMSLQRAYKDEDDYLISPQALRDE